MRAAAARAHARVGARVKLRLPSLDMQVVRLPRGLSVRDAAKRYGRDPAVRFAEPNYLRRPSVVPTDALFGELWGLQNAALSHPVSGGGTTTGAAGADIDAPTAWDVEQGDGTVVAVIDSGVQVTHPDLATQIWTNPGEIPGNDFDDEGNGKIDDVNGWDFGDGDDSLLGSFDGAEHGTHVAGTIAAALDGTEGVVGVCPQCRIMVLKIARDADDGSMPVSAEIAALAYAKSKGAKIANLSFGAPGFVNAEREALRKSGLLAVVAAGNESLDNDMALASDLGTDGVPDIASPAYPAAYTLPTILTVAASNDHDENAYFTGCRQDGFSKAMCAFTNWGHESVDVSAPGVDITSTVPDDYDTFDGTSMAAPHVAGVAALVLARHPGYTVAQVKNAVMRSVERPTTLQKMFIAPAPGVTRAQAKLGRFTRTAGRVNAANALDASTANATPLTDGNVDGARLMSKSRVRGTVSWPADVNDVRQRKLRRGVTYRFTLVVPRGKDYDLIVWKPRTKEIWQFSRLRAASARAGSVDEVVKFRARATGVYYIQVSAWLYKSGRYSLRFARL
jgi:subtilisin family serine protease